MLIIQLLAPRILELRLSGTLTRDDILRFEAGFDPVLKDLGPIGVVIHLEGIEDMTADALAEDVRYEAGLLAHLARFRRVAVVSDKRALGAMARFIDPLLPMIDLRTFRPDEAEAARAFVKDLEGAPDATALPGVRLIDSSSPSVVAYEIDGWISSRDADKVFEPLEAAAKRQGSVSLLVRWRTFAGFDPRLLADPDLWAHKLAAVQTVRRYALVGAPAWLASAAEHMAPLLPMEVCAFNSSHEADAWEWVRAA